MNTTGVSVVSGIVLTMCLGSVQGEVGLDDSDGYAKAYRASALMNRDVRSVQGQRLGRIQDLVLARDGRLLYVVIPAADSANRHGRLIPIPWRAVHPSSRGEYFVVTVSPERLREAPAVGDELWQFADRGQWNEQVFEYYGYDFNDYLNGSPKDPSRGKVGHAFLRLDDDGDGYLNRREAARDEGLTKAFERMDGNRDGWLSVGEFSAFEVHQLQQR